MRGRRLVREDGNAKMKNEKRNSSEYPGDCENIQKIDFRLHKVGKNRWQIIWNGNFDKRAIFYKIGQVFPNDSFCQYMKATDSDDRIYR